MNTQRSLFGSAARRVPRSALPGTVIAIAALATAACSSSAPRRPSRRVVEGLWELASAVRPLKSLLKAGLVLR
jgi:hypothetical protein